ncbi:hypothetical protein HOY80DRAFT_238681 [Tuber brumale]|nr:hypothetical protein HOY80DRAFT_238681 [Tuber brumale]
MMSIPIAPVVLMKGRGTACFFLSFFLSIILYQGFVFDLFVFSPSNPGLSIAPPRVVVGSLQLLGDLSPFPVDQLKYHCHLPYGILSVIAFLCLSFCLAVVILCRTSACPVRLCARTNHLHPGALKL